MIEILISNDDGPAKFRQVATFEGRTLGKGKMPFYDACRELIKEGRDPDELVAMRWKDKSTVSFLGKIGTFASKSIKENDTEGPKIVKFRPFDETKFK